MNDTELVKRAQGGDVNAVGLLYDRHQEHIFRFVWSRVRNPYLAEDLTAEIFTRMVKGLPAYRQAGLPFRAWLFRIARNLIVDHIRKEGAYTRVSLRAVEEFDSGQRSPGAVVEQHLKLEQVHYALEQLDELQREVIVLRFLIGLSLKEVGEALDKSVAAVKSLQQRGLAAIRLHLPQP